MTELEISQAILNRLGIHRKRLYSFGDKEMVSCPFHGDNHPSCSMKIVESGGLIYKCFSCGKHGTGRALFKELKGISINRALDIPYEKQEEAETSLLKSLFIKTKVQEAVSIDKIKTPDVHIGLSGTLVPASKNEMAIEYLNKRKIPLKVADRMRMSYAISARTFDSLEPNNFRKQVDFSKRLLIPIYENGKMISCEARDIEGKDAFEKRIKAEGLKVDYKKCLYPIGASTSTLYQLEKLDKTQTIYFVEGLMDLAVLRSDKFFNEKNSTAIFGASLAERQVYLLSQFDSFVQIVDNDLAGFQSALRLYNKLKELCPDRLEKCNWRFLIPPYKDIGVKDVGDIPVKAGRSIEEIRSMRWLEGERQFKTAEEFLKAKVTELAELKKTESKKRRIIVDDSTTRKRRIIQE